MRADVLRRKSEMITRLTVALLIVILFVVAGWYRGTVVANQAIAANPGHPCDPDQVRMRMQIHCATTTGSGGVLLGSLIFLLTTCWAKLKERQAAEQDKD